MEKCKRRAKEGIIWPGINKSMEQMVRSCHICQAKAKEPMIPHSVPTKPWQKAGSNLFECNNKMYLIVADYYSLFPKVYLLTKNPRTL